MFPTVSLLCWVVFSCSSQCFGFLVVFPDLTAVVYVVECVVLCCFTMFLVSCFQLVFSCFNFFNVVSDCSNCFSMFEVAMVCSRLFHVVFGGCTVVQGGVWWVVL